MQLSQRTVSLLAASATAVGLVLATVGSAAAEGTAGAIAVAHLVPKSTCTVVAAQNSASCWKDPSGPALSTLTISYATPYSTPKGTTTFPLFAGEQVQINVDGGAQGSTPLVTGTGASGTFDGTCTPVNKSGYSLCTIEIPLTGALPISEFTVTDHLNLPPNNLPEVPFAAGLPLLLTLGVPLRRYLAKARRA